MLTGSVHAQRSLPCSAKHDYMRLDPYRKKELFVFVDYTQKDLVETIKNTFIQSFSERLNGAVEFIQVRIGRVPDIERASLLTLATEDRLDVDGTSRSHLRFY